MNGNGNELRQEQLSSVTLSRNAKGGVQPEVKIYNEDPQQAAQLAQTIFDSLCEKYQHAG